MRIRTALDEHSELVCDLLAARLAYLGSKAEWSLDDNLDTTEVLARLAERIGLPPAGDQDAPALEFYDAAASYLAYDAE